MSSKAYESRLKDYYNKFNEDKRLLRRHGRVEFETTMHYILEYVKEFENPKILDIGAGTGRYSIALHNLGYQIDAVELFKCNLNVLKKNCPDIPSYEGNALDLSFLPDHTYDLTLLFGPMYHLHSLEDCLKALSEAKRVTKHNGIIMVAYVMNDYCIITRVFKEKHFEELDQVDDSYHIVPSEQQLYHVVRVEDIDKYDKMSELQRIKIIACDGQSDYMRDALNKLSEEEFNIFLDYHLKTCERYELLGASSHTLDILRNI